MNEINCPYTWRQCLINDRAASGGTDRNSSIDDYTNCQTPPTSSSPSSFDATFFDNDLGPPFTRSLREEQHILLLQIIDSALALISKTDDHYVHDSDDDANQDDEDTTLRSTEVEFFLDEEDHDFGQCPTMTVAMIAPFLARNDHSAAHNIGEKNNHSGGRLPSTTRQVRGGSGGNVHCCLGHDGESSVNLDAPREITPSTRLIQEPSRTSSIIPPALSSTFTNTTNIVPTSLVRGGKADELSCINGIKCQKQRTD
jgi:hypothetical protein